MAGRTGFLVMAIQYTPALARLSGQFVAERPAKWRSTLQYAMKAWHQRLTLATSTPFPNKSWRVAALMPFPNSHANACAMRYRVHATILAE